MKIERFDCTGRMSRVVKYGDMLFLSGVTAGQAGESVEEQTKAVLARIEELLSSMARIRSISFPPPSTSRTSAISPV